MNTSIKQLVASLNEELEFYRREIEKYQKCVQQIEQQIVTLEDMVENREFDQDKLTPKISVHGREIIPMPKDFENFIT